MWSSVKDSIIFKIFHFPLLKKIGGYNHYILILSCLDVKQFCLYEFELHNFQLHNCNVTRMYYNRDTMVVFSVPLQIIRISVEKTRLTLLDPEVASKAESAAWDSLDMASLTLASLGNSAEIQFQCKGLGFVRLVCSIVCALVLCRPTWQQLYVHIVFYIVFRIILFLE